MKEKRSYRFEGKVFSKNDIISLAKIFQTEEEKTIGTKVDFSIECTDRTSYESESLAIFDEDFITSTEIESISFWMYNYEEESSLNLLISSKHSSGALVVKGSDRDWVGAKFFQLKETISRIKNQENWFIKNQKTVFHLLAISFGFPMHNLYILFLSLFVKPIQNPSANLLIVRDFMSSNPLIVFILQLIFYWCTGYVFAMILISWISKLWPKIEFDFVSEHLQKHKKRRKTMFFILSLFILPIIANVFYDLAKEAFHIILNP
ncbi:hypothetical protein VBD025_03950 [Virgibacillus flavescens]|uniref:hypothetical protein n=1 Tax=Virgibacillus flavescens TaxID=1611422 RepID=UPI003D33019A